MEQKATFRCRSLYEHLLCGDVRWDDNKIPFKKERCVKVDVMVLEDSYIISYEVGNDHLDFELCIKHNIDILF